MSDTKPHHQTHPIAGRPSTSNYDPYGGWNDLPIPNTHGYFSVAQVNGRSWFVTPASHAFFSIGVNFVTFGSKPATDDSYDQRMFERYRNDPSAWANVVGPQLSAWGFNTLGGFCSTDITHHGLAESRALFLTSASINAPYNVRRVNGNFADVFDPAFSAAISQILTTAISPADITDTWILGYYLDNELCWYKGCFWNDTPTATLSEDFIALPRDAAGKQAWVSYLTANYPTIADLNKKWGTNYTSFSGAEPTSLLNVTSITSPGATGDKYAFLSLIAEQYYRLTCAAVRARDPHHLILGDRYVAIPLYREIVAAASRYVDVISINIYERGFADNLVVDYLDQAAAYGKPVMISEYGFRATNSGLPNVPNVPAPLLPTDRDRAAAYELLVSECARRPVVLGAHWFMHADRAILDTHTQGGYYGHQNWGLVDINNNPYPDLISHATTYNSNIYYHRQGQAAPQPPPPTPLAPPYNATIFTTGPAFSWRAVNGASSYTVQVDRRIDFTTARTYTTSASGYTLPPNTLDAGRWYWRVRAVSGVGDPLAYSAPRPFYVLRQTAALTVSGFETPEEVTLQGAGPNFRWTQEVNGDLSMGPTNIGVTEGAQAALLTFSGLTGGLTDHYSWAMMYRYPRGTSFSPRDWRGYDYLTLDVTNPGGDLPAPLLNLDFRDDAGRGNGISIPIRSGSSQVTVSVDDAIAGGMNAAAIADLRIGLRRPAPQTQLAIDNFTLRQAPPVPMFQPPITARATDLRVGGAVLIDWHDYQPVPTTVAYDIYVGESADFNPNSTQPTLRIDAVAQSTVLRVRYVPGSPSPDPSGFNTLQNGQTYYVNVVAVDKWGNAGAAGLAAVARPTECGIEYSDVPTTYWAYTFITHLTCLGILSGGGATFSPGDPTLRGQFAKMITLLRNWPLLNPPRPSFSDVPPTHPFYQFIETAAARGVITGLGQAACQPRGLAAPCFLPGDPVTRAQAAIILVAAHGWAIDTSGGPHFSDVPPSYFAYGSIETCYHRGVINGVGGGLFAPGANITRAQAAKILYQALRQFPRLPTLANWQQPPV